MINIEKLSGEVWRVTVDGDTTTHHEVTVPAAYFEQLTGGAGIVEDLLVRSFEFLLARESNTSILRAFELSVISRYFPEYEDEIRAG